MKILHEREQATHFERIASLLIAVQLLAGWSWCAANPSAECAFRRTAYELREDAKSGILQETAAYKVLASSDDLTDLGTVMSTYEYHPTAVEVRLFRRGKLECKRTLVEFLSIAYLKDEELFVSDARLLIPPLPPLQPGDSLWVSARYRIEPFLGFPVHSFGSGNMQIRSSTLTVTIPNSLAPEFICLNGAPPPERKSRDKKTTLTWRVNDLRPAVEEERGPSPEDTHPAVSIGVRSIAWGPSRTWEELAATCWNHVRPTVISLDPSAGGLSTKLAAASVFEECLFKVQENVRYVAMALGPGGKIPHRSDEVLRKRYGDCKDMSVLILSMLGADADRASLALVRTRGSGGDHVDPLPTLSYFNHAVVCATTETGEFWLDATDNLGTQRFPRADIQGAPALVVAGPAPGFRRIPVTGAKENRSTTVLLLHEDSDRWRATLTLTAQGWRAHELRRRIGSMADAAKVLSLVLERSHVSPLDIIDPEDARWSIPSPDSVVLSCTVPIKAPLAQSGYTIRWDAEPYPFTIFRERERTNDVYWPSLETLVDSVTVLTNRRFTGARDTTWSASEEGLDVQISRRVLPEKMQDVRTVSIGKGTFAAASWALGRDLRTKIARWSTRPIGLEAP